MFFNAIKSTLTLATRGVPGVLAAVHGARIGAGAKFGKATIETLGIKVVPAAAFKAAASGGVAGSIAAGGVEAALSVTNATPVVRVGGFIRNGVALRVSPTGAVAASVSEELVASAAKSTVKSAASTALRATAVGAVGGAALDALITGVPLIPGLINGSVSRGDAATKVGKSAARGAVSGGMSVAAAGIVSALIGASGITVAAAPVVIPFVAMVAVGALTSRAFDKRFGTGSAPKLASGG